ncbi:MAG: hypothetical protein A3G34_09435 [Candidatus Lindowbacteria bacterium RIFCSPLOWO2_12_FULL_62_27]|nr:MAG: hypothetical protein A3I06_08100 [Candidatus Lindowbacteria bacterium RIFCSPLOWO2_02_FULL_62_12]OGH60259.1 MAG: hypothetical protein A3G34_09435 [Candidatus Lindowbacteria bacterium RIFCSPLOWO2_12_FULL_62_27]
MFVAEVSASLVLLHLALFFPAATPQPSDLVSEFMCPCPDRCGKALEVCECSDAAGYIQELMDLRSRGLSREAVREKFVEKYGPSVLASPPAKGFGLVVYLLPPLAVLGGAVLAVGVARRWKRRPVGAPKVTDADLKRAEEAMKKWRS